MEEGKVLDQDPVILAEHACTGRKYLTRAGREVIVQGRQSNRVIVLNVYTGNEVPLPLDYELREAEAVRPLD